MKSRRARPLAGGSRWLRQARDRPPHGDGIHARHLTHVAGQPQSENDWPRNTGYLFPGRFTDRAAASKVGCSPRRLGG